MAETTIFDLTRGTAISAGDVFVYVDVLDSAESPEGTTKGIVASDLFTLGIDVTVTATLDVDDLVVSGSVSSTVQFDDDILVGVNKFSVDAATGNTVVVGTLNLTGALTAGTGTFTVGSTALIVTGTSLPLKAKNTAVAGTNQIVELTRGTTVVGSLGADASDDFIIMSGLGVGAITVARTSAICTFSRILMTVASSTAEAGLRLVPGVAPTSPVNGDVWLTTAGLFYRANGSTVGPVT
jgi:hypothetical protein